MSTSTLPSAGGSSNARPKMNLRSTAVKRIMQEASELSSPEDDLVAAPLEVCIRPEMSLTIQSDIFEWHCTVKGVEGSPYEGGAFCHARVSQVAECDIGLYHIRILLPPSYPMSAPDIILMTPNGRFELGKKASRCFWCSLTI